MKVKNFIRAVWEFPQNALGCIVTKLTKARVYTVYKDAVVYSWKNGGGMSLGKYIFVPFPEAYPMRYGVEQFIKHEYGHTLQSKKLGWLYLLVIGLPSLIWAQCFQWYRNKTSKSYYSFYTEKWANKLGGVERW